MRFTCPGSTSSYAECDLVTGSQDLLVDLTLVLRNLDRNSPAGVLKPEASLNATRPEYLTHNPSTHIWVIFSLTPTTSIEFLAFIFMNLFPAF